MKHANSKGIIKIALLFIVLCTCLNGLAQDTLHLVYHYTQIKPHDSTEAKIDKWIKSLNGKHMDISVVSYYHKSEFKKFSQERCDELFLVLNRKARALLTIESIEPKKGSDSQRTTVDIIYKPTVTAEELAAIKKAEAEKAAAEKAEEEKKKEKEKVAKESNKKTKESDVKKSKSDVAAENTKKSDSDDKKEGKGKKGKDDDEDDGDYGHASSRTYVEGASMSLQELKYIKSAKLIVAKTGKESIDTKLYDAVKGFWNFTSDVVQMPYDEARKIGKENKKDTMVILSFIKVKTWFTEKHGNIILKFERIGYALSIENGKGKILIKQFIPKPKGIEPSYVHFVFGVTVLNDLCHIMDENNLAKSTKSDEFIDLRTPELKDKTLLLGESQINKKLPLVEIPAYYTSPYDIVSDEKWEEAILQKKDVAYAMVVLFPVNPKRFFHYIIDAKTGRTYYLDLNSKVSISMGWGTPGFSATQSGFIDKSNFESYEKGINKAIEDNEKRAQKEEKAIEKEKKKSTEESEKKAKKEKKEKDEENGGEKKTKKEDEKKKKGEKK